MVDAVVFDGDLPFSPSHVATVDERERLAQLPYTADAGTSADNLGDVVGQFICMDDDILRGASIDVDQLGGEFGFDPLGA